MGSIASDRVWVDNKKKEKMKKKIKGDVKIGKGKRMPIEPSALPMNLSIKELAKICCEKGVQVTITLEEK